MIDINDKNTLYLYQNGWGEYKIGTIYKVNQKSIKMSDYGTLIKIDELDSKLHKLTEEEIFNYRQELVKFIGNSDQYHNINIIISNLQKALETIALSDFVCLNTEKLQKQISTLEKELEEFLPGCLELACKKLVFDVNGDIKEIKK